MIATLLFVLSVAIVHYFQQVYTSTFFELLTWLRIPAVLLGIVTLYFVMQYFKKQPSNILYYTLAFFIGLITITYQQTCVMNWSAIFEQWLNDQHLSNWEASLYQLLYQLVYILPLILFLFIYFLFLRIKRFAALGKKLTNIGLLF